MFAAAGISYKHLGDFDFKDLVLKAESPKKISGACNMSAQARLELLLPHMMPGSQMPPMINMEPYLVFIRKPSLVVVPLATSLMDKRKSRMRLTSI